MRRSLLAFVVGGVLLVGCAGPVPATPTANVSIDADGNIYLAISGPHNSGGSTSFAPSGIPAIHFASFGYPAESVSNIYAFGLAPHGTAYIETVPPGTATIDSHGLFVVVIPEAGVSQIPTGVHWRFMSGPGVVLSQGSGEANDDPGWGYSILRSAQPTQP